MDLQQFKSRFIEEAFGLLDRFEKSILVLEKQPARQDSADEVFRAMHTLKGVSGMYGFDAVVDVTHELEHLYDQMRDGRRSFTSELADLSLTIGDHIRSLLADEGFTRPDLQAQHMQLLDRLHRLSGAAPMKVAVPKHVSPQGFETFSILFTPDQSLIFRNVNVLATFSDLLALGQWSIRRSEMEGNERVWSILLVTDKGKDEIEDILLFILDNCIIQKIADFDIFNEDELEKHEASFLLAEENLQPDPILKPLSPSLLVDNDSDGNSLAPVQTRIPVEASKLDELMYLVSELVTAKSELQLAIDSKNFPMLIKISEKIDKLSKKFRDNALNVRLVSMLDMSTRFERMVRDLSRKLNKKIEFECHGGETELDKNVIDSIAEPIMHLIRNCIDHGIELPEERIALGKPELGIVKFFAFKSGNNVFIQISDNGRGIDAAKIRAKAIERGIIAADAKLSTKQLYDIIFIPGFSTAESLTQISGRGVGMDIVLKTIQQIRGDISVDSEPGLGTSFTIKLQQTISIIDTLLVEAAGSKFAIPLEDIEICGLERHSALRQRHDASLCFQDELLPYISLRDALCLPGIAPEKEKIVIISKYDKRFAVIADRIVGEYQAVVKPLGTAFARQEFFSGASILGDGSLALLLDASKLALLNTAHSYHFNEMLQ